MKNGIIIITINFLFFATLLATQNILIAGILSLTAVVVLVHFHPKISFLDKFETTLVKIKFFTDDRILLFLLISLMAFMLLETIIGFGLALIVAFTLFCRLAKLNNAVFFISSLMLVVTAAISAASGQEATTKEIGVLIYYFLIVGIVKQMMQIIRNEQFIPLLRWFATRRVVKAV